MQDLFDALEEKWSPAEIVERLSEFDKDKLEEYAIKNEICPDCYEELIRQQWDETRGEFWGCPCTEIVGVLMCEMCGWVDE